MGTIGHHEEEVPLSTDPEEIIFPSRKFCSKMLKKMNSTPVELDFVSIAFKSVDAPKKKYYFRYLARFKLEVNSLNDKGKVSQSASCF